LKQLGVTIQHDCQTQADYPQNTGSNDYSRRNLKHWALLSAFQVQLSRAALQIYKHARNAQLNSYAASGACPELAPAIRPLSISAYFRETRARIGLTKAMRPFYGAGKIRPARRFTASAVPGLAISGTRPRRHH
jgi:hypothetical protein